MAGKTRYTDDDRATVLVALDANLGNVKRTSRETGVAEQTVRDWKKQAERGDTPATVEAALPAVVSEFAKNTERVRDLMLDQLEAAVLNNEVKGRDLIVGIGVLTDKLRITRGEATSRTETVEKPPTAEALGAALKEYLERSFDAGEKRDADIVLSDEDISDAEWEQAPQGELPVETS